MALPRLRDLAQRPPDNAIYAIVGSNLLVLVGAAVWGGGLLHFLWPFWLQSVIIGWYAQQRIRVLREYCADGVEFNDQPVAPTPENARFAANFFVMHYGGFHAIYAVFLLAFTRQAAESGLATLTDSETGELLTFEAGRFGDLDWLWLVGVGISFWLTHRASFREHVATDLARVPKLGTLMFMPYARILPMHLTIIFGALVGGGRGAVLLFGVLKTAADLVMHKVEHHVYRRGDTGPPT